MWGATAGEIALGGYGLARMGVTRAARAADDVLDAAVGLGRAIPDTPAARALEDLAATRAALTVGPTAAIRNQVAYGSTDLSQLARSYRAAEGITSARNIAVFEYIDELGEIQTLTMANQRGVGHAERRIANALEDLGIPPENVTRIYSELHPCGSLPGGYCDRMIRNNFPDADVSYSFEYGDQESRSRGIEALRGALDELFGE